MTSLWKALSDNLALVLLLVVTLLMLALLALVISAALRGGGAPGAGRSLGTESLRRSFRKAVKLIEANLAARAERYNLAWTLVLNEGAHELPLREAGLQSALSADSTLDAAAQGIAWNFFDKGVVVQLRSEYLGSPEPDAAAGNHIWDDFLGLCRTYRPQRPFDCIVLAIPCADLLHSDAAGQMALVARAKAIHRRLWLAQNRLAMRFPIHIVVTECESLPGFAAFGSALPEGLRRSMLGWVSPYELVAPFRAEWVASAMDQITGAVADSCAELSALEAPDADSSAYFLLPSEVERLRTGLALFCGELMQPSAYHESFLLRGMYLTGDCSLEAMLLAGADNADNAPAPRAAMPVFLRDIFERKIFAEVGLVRSSAQRLRGAARGSLAYWSAMSVPLVWALGLVVATYQLNSQGARLVSYLKSLDSAALSGAPVGERSWKNAVAALEGFNRLGDVRFGSVFMPGSWPWFDDLHDDLRLRLEKGFADNAIAALRAAAAAQVNQLTGAARDPATGALVSGGACTRPAGWDEEAGLPAADLNLKDLPEYRAMLSYLDRLDQINTAVDATERLTRQDKAPASSADLALVVRILLKSELRHPTAHTAALFRAAAHGHPVLAYKVIEDAAACSLRLGSEAMYQRLFDNNALLRAERAVGRSAEQLQERSRHGASFASQLQPWQQLRKALDEQKAQLVAVKGGWMHQSELRLGSAQDDLLKRIENNGLLGPGAMRQTQDLAEQHFSQFRKAWASALADHGLDGGEDGGIVWTGAKDGWVATPERMALQESVAALMALPYMKGVAQVRLPEVPAGASVRWDRGQLERAASLAEARKAFQGGVYTTLPLLLQQGASDLVDKALAASAYSALAQGLSVTPQELPSAASDAERASVLRIRDWLRDIGAAGMGAELDAIVARDALSRLARLDAVVTAAELYLPDDPGLQRWQGQKGAMLDTFGGGDMAGLNAYMERQQEFIDTAGQQAEGVLTALAALAANDPLVLRWQGLAADLRRYRLKSPTSNRMALEQFIVAGSADIDVANCAERLAPRQTQRRGADVFAERLQSLQSAMLARCRDLAAREGRRQWQQFAESYNRDLARRVPFVMQPATGPAAAPADRDTVGSVLKLYERARAGAMLAEREQAGAPPAVRQADAQLRRVRDVLAPLYPVEEGQVGGLDVSVQFRANQAAEVDANKIIDWSLTIGPATVRLADAPRALRWEPGMPVVLALRLARDGSAIPRVEAGRGNVSVAERTISFRFDDPWALFTFIGAHRESDSAGESTPSVLLRVEFPLTTDATATAGTAPPATGTGDRARVFLRLKVSAPGKQTALVWPAVFPAQAPLWQ